MIHTPLTIEDYQRGENAKLAVKAIRNRATSKLTPQAISLAVYILALINQAMDYTRHNLGEVQPVEFTNLFTHSDTTIRTLNKARAHLKQLHSCLNIETRRETKTEFVTAMEYLKDLQGYIAVQIKRGVKNA